MDKIVEILQVFGSPEWLIGFVVGLAFGIPITWRWAGRRVQSLRAERASLSDDIDRLKEQKASLQGSIASLNEQQASLNASILTLD